jgi:hypothetical protein
MKLSEQFALNQWLTDYPENLTYDEVIDLMLGDEDEWTQDEITVWQTVEHFTLRQIVEFIEDTRKHFAAVTKEEK